jgi:hypothetical protein
LREWASEGVLSDLKWRSGLPFRRHYIPIINNTQQYPNYHFTITATNHKTILHISIYTLRPEDQTRLAEDIQSYISDRQRDRPDTVETLKSGFPTPTHDHADYCTRTVPVVLVQRSSQRQTIDAMERCPRTIAWPAAPDSDDETRRTIYGPRSPSVQSANPQFHMLDSAAPSGKQYADKRKDRRFLAHF